jgi:hypothetical protein
MTRILWPWGALVLLAAVGWFNYRACTEAYGSGPPYYGRTTNMDKWSDPRPLLIKVDAAAALLLGLWWFRASRPGRRA